MKQVTGSNPLHTAQRVSIQLKLDGHSFSADSLPAAGTEGVVCELLTSKTQLVPQEEFSPAAAEALLRAAGMACSGDECPVWSDPSLPAVAVMAFDTTAVNTLRTRYAERIEFTSPLLFRPRCVRSTVWLYKHDELLYIKVYRDGLRFAEVLTAENDADLLYYTELLGREFPLREFELYPAGKDARTARDLLHRFFGSVAR